MPETIIFELLQQEIKRRRDGNVGYLLLTDEEIVKEIDEEQETFVRGYLETEEV